MEYDTVDPMIAHQPSFPQKVVPDINVFGTFHRGDVLRDLNAGPHVFNIQKKY